MVMIRSGGKPQKLAEKIMRANGSKVEKKKKMAKEEITGPYLQHYRII
jgi:hypothetical protein